MTLLEKAMQEHPTLDEDRIISFLCPVDLGYEDGVCVENLAEADEQEACRRCWNREATDGKTDCHTSAAALARNDGGGPDNGG